MEGAYLHLPRAQEEAKKRRTFAPAGSERAGKQGEEEQLPKAERVEALVEPLVEAHD